MSHKMKNVVLTGPFTASQAEAVTHRAAGLGVAVFGAVTKDIDAVVVGTSMIGVSAKAQRARELGVEIITESEFIKRLTVLEIKQLTEFKVKSPAQVADNQPRYDWNVGDNCWASNDVGYVISDDLFEFIGDDVTLEIIALYDSDGTPMSVVRRHPQGAHQCFRVDMLHPIKLKRDKVIDKAVEASTIKQTGFMSNYHRKIIERLYDKGMLNNEAVV